MIRPETTHFFATRDDIEPGLRSAERIRPVKYVLSGFMGGPEVEILASGLAIPHLGVNLRGRPTVEQRYLVVDAASPVQVRAVPQRRGGGLYAADEVANPSGIFFWPSGLFQERCLIMGQVDGFGDPQSLNLYRTFARRVLKGFARIRGTYVGPEAEHLLDGGARLTQDASAPVECDLRRAAAPRARDAAGVRAARLPLEATWEYLRAHGYEAPTDAGGRPLIGGAMPSFDDSVLGLHFFRTGLEDEDLGALTIPRTYFARSEFRRVAFRDTDLSESRMCWNDWLECDFSQADLTGADMRASLYEQCRFVGAALAGADLRRSRFEACDFAAARMRGAKLTYRQGAGLGLTERQRYEVDWQAEDGPEPPGG